MPHRTGVAKVDNGELGWELLVLAVLALVCMGLTTWLWRQLDLASRLLPPQRQRDVPWGGFEVLGVIFLYFAAVVFADSLLVSLGWYDRLYGPNFVKETSDLLKQNPIAKARRGLWMSVAGFPFQVTSILLMLYSVSGTRPYQLGLTTYRLCRNLVLGFLAWVAVAPLILAILTLVALIYQQFGMPPEKHVFEELARGELTLLEWIMLAVGAVVAAPVVEELVFRGVIQRFLMTRWWGGDVALAGAYVLAILSRWNGLKDAVELKDHGKLLTEAQPALFVLAMLAVYMVVRLYWSSPVARTIYGVALLFAAAHSFAWPSPIPLFALGLALGWLAHRTQSLVPSITLHALFNSIAVITLLLPGSEDQKGKAETTAPRRPAAVSTSTLVPGS